MPKTATTNRKNKVRIKTSYSNVRKGPGLNFSVIDKLQNGTDLYVQGNWVSDWVFVYYFRNGKKRFGYIYAGNLTKIYR